MAIQNWIAMRCDLGGDPAVIRMSQKLQVRTEVVVGYLHAVWSWLDRNTDDGVIHGCELEAIEQHLALPNFLRLMCEVGWLEYESETLTVPHWDRWFSESAKKRLKKTAQQRIRRRSQNEAKMKPKKDVTCSSSSLSSSSNSASSYSSSFNLFWTVCNPKTGKAAAAKAYERAIKRIRVENPDLDGHGFLRDRMRAYVNSDVGRSKFVKYPTTWLNAGCWDDDDDAWNRKEDVVDQNDMSWLDLGDSK